MRKFLLLNIIFFAINSYSLFAQDVKSKAVVFNERPSIEITILENRTIQVQNATVGQKLQVFSVIGLKVAEFEVKSPTVEYQLNVPRGYYIIKIGEVVRKVVLR